MKLVSLTLHARSAFVGAALSCAVWLAISALPQQSVSSRPLQVQLDPDPSFVVRITEGKPYTVPDHRLLAIKTVFPPNISSTVILFNGDAVLKVSSGSGPEPVTLPIPLVAQPGDVVTLAPEVPLPEGEIAVALGYLSHD